MSLLVFNGLLYGEHMAPGVKQDTVQVPWQTPPTYTIGSATYMLVPIKSHYDRINQLAALRDMARFWRRAYLLACAQYTVALAAAVWGWTR